MIKIVATNKKAYHDFFIEDSYEAGIELQGSEVKSIRNGAINLKDSYVQIKDGEAMLINTHISPYSKGSHFNPEPRRTRRLLLHKYEIRKLRQKVLEKGYTIVPVKVYLKQGLVKIEIALAKGKDAPDKRRTIMEREVKREMERHLKERDR
ncbi:MAG: SsrA-binding protein SmpB [Clostridiales bacterium]|jgi:SsrA-binding protein|nr:SsrA-binding protein SmpB [Clostridiales bacterium]